MSAIISVSNLEKQYKNKTAFHKAVSFRALQGISFEVDTGEIFGVLGPNGAGKTTTLEILETIKQPTSGQVLVFGRDITKDARFIKAQIGVQLQTSEYLPLLSLVELINMFASFYKRSVKPLELLEFVGLKDKARAEVKQLSGGQKQRFTIATTLVNQPKIIFLDEPTTGLDPQARRKIWTLIKDLNAQGITIVLTTHYMEEAEYLCHRVAIMDQGKILTIDNPKTLINKLSHTTQISFFTDSVFSENFWQGVANIEKVYSISPKVIIEVKDLDGIGSILNHLKTHHISFTGFTVKTATLEDVYLDLTGRELSIEHTN